MKDRIVDFSFGLIKEFADLKEFGSKAIPVNYYARHNNWGDQVNPYLISKMSNKPVRKTQLKNTKHMAGIGSVITTANEKSIIWGSGFISKDIKLKVSKIDVRAVRGYLTKARLENEYNISGDFALGDPVVLIKEFYNPKVTRIKKIGIVAHYKDKELPIIKKLIKLGCGLINIQSDSIESFIDDILQYEYVFSSSLHGLIVADTYGIPNARLVFSDMVAGGDFKFLDYYSTTDNKSPEKLVVELDVVGQDFLLEAVKLCRISYFLEDKEKLKNSFPISDFNG